MKRIIFSRDQDLEVFCYTSFDNHFEGLSIASIALDDTEVDLSVSLRKIPSIESVTRSFSPPVRNYINNLVNN